jgi:diguanylate cyclase (GGDEF)-like protein/PAS domain S-box-containing protein
VRGVTLRLPAALPSGRALAFACVVLIGAGWLVTLERIASERRETVDSVIQINSNLALAFEAHTVRTLKGAEQVLALVDLEFEEHGEHISGAYLERARLVDAAAVSFVGIVNRGGQLVAGTRVFKVEDVSDREYFQYHRATPGAALRVGKPLVSRLTGQVEIPLSRRVDAVDGRFDGVVVAGISPDYFTGFYDELRAAGGAVVKLIGHDGVVLAAAADADRAAAAGASRDPRHMSYRTLDEYGLVIAVGAPVSEQFAGFAERRRNYLAGASVVTAFVLLAALGLMLALRRHRAAARAAAREAGRYRAAFDQAVVGMVHTAPDGRLLKANRRFCEMLGYAERELVGRPLIELVHPDDVAGARELLLAGEEERRVALEKRHVRKDGSVAWAAVSVSAVRDEDGRPDYMLALVQDITARKDAQERLAYQAHHDALTGLPNRLLFYDHLEQALSQAGRKAWSAAVLFVGLDRFKSVNETLGAAIGDRMLQETARRLERCVRPGDTVARLGGDEFALVLSEVGGPEDAGSAAGRVMEALSAPFRFEEHQAYVTASVGLALYPPDATDPHALANNAATALTRAKESGGNCMRFYTSAMNEHALARLQLENDLHAALERGEFRLHFQPRQRLSTGEVTGFEALLRWQHPTRGLVLPGEFIPVLEESGLIVAVGDWVIDAVCAQLRAWDLAGLSTRPVAINVAALQFAHRDLARVIERALSAHRLAPGLLEVEITESALMDGSDQTMNALARLRQNRVRVAIDDFGTGYSSLAYLKRLPVDVLKLDRSFVTGLPHDREDACIARAVIALGQTLGLRVVAEGVENEAQRAFLAHSGCDEIQGFLIGRPLPAEQCAQLMATPRRCEALAKAG